MMRQREEMSKHYCKEGDGSCEVSGKGCALIREHGSPGSQSRFRHLLAVLQLTHLKNRIVTRIKWANVYFKNKTKHNIAQSKCYVSVKLNMMLNSLSFNFIESFYLRSSFTLIRFNLSFNPYFEFLTLITM